MLEDDADAAPRDLVRGPARDIGAVDANEPASGRSMPMMSFITVDLPEPFGPIRPRILPAWTLSAMSLTATRPP